MFQIYLRKLERITPKLGARSKDNTALNKTLDALNVSPDEQVTALLALCAPVTECVSRRDLMVFLLILY